MNQNVAPDVRPKPYSIWIAVTLFSVVLTIFGVEIWFASRRAALDLSGDPLLDKYILAVWERSKVATNQPTSLPDHPQYAALADVVEWEEDYSTDPRYWQLRFILDYNTKFFTGLGGISNQTFADVMKHADPPLSLDYIESTSSDPETRWLLHQFQLAQQRDLHDAHLLTVIIDTLGDKLSPETRLALARAAVAADAADPRAQYHLGLALLETGEPEQSLEHLQLCNGSERSCSSQLFPQDQITEIMGRGEQLGNAEVSIRISLLDLTSSSRMFYLVPILKELLSPELLVEHPAVFQELCQAILHLAEDGTYTEVLMSFLALEAATRSMSEVQGNDLTVEQQDTLDKIQAVKGQANQYWLQTVQSNEMPSELVTKIPMLGERKSLDWIMDSCQAEQEMLENDIRPLIRLLEDIDFTTLEMPDSLMDFKGPYQEE